MGNTHERLPCGCNGGNSWNYIRRGIRDITGTTSDCAAGDTDVLPKRPKRREPKKIAALRLSQAMGGSGSLDRKAPSLQEFSTRFLSWVESATLAGKSKKYYRNGWRLLSKTKIVSVRLDHIAKDDVAGLSFSGSPANADRAHYCPKSRRVRTPQSPGWRRSASFHLVSYAFGEKAKCSLDLRTQWLELWPTPSPKHRRNTGLESFGFEFTRPERLN